MAQAVSYLAEIVTNKTDTVAPDFSDAVQALAQAKRPLILCSTLHGNPALVAAARDLAGALDQTERRCFLAYIFSAVNSFGSTLLRSIVPPSRAIEDVQRGKVKAVVAVETDLTEAFGSVESVKQALSPCELVLAIESVEKLRGSCNL